jgi:hypothetical protein
MNGCKAISISTIFFLLLYTLPVLAESLGRDFDTGLGLYKLQLYRSAFTFLLPVAEAGHAKAQYQVGYMYFVGEGVQKNIQEAIKWYKKSAEQGFVLPQLILGAVYLQGNGIAKDPQEAFKWYRKAAELGNPDAQHNVAYMYQEGIGVDQSDEEAFNWYHRAALQGQAMSQYNLGIMYAAGRGTLQDEITAYAWLYIASLSGLKEPKGELEKIEANALADSTEIELGREIARELIDKYKLLVN